MKRTLKVHSAGLLTSVQDQGRVGYQSDGIPVAGVMDDYAHQLANILVGNDRDQAVIEVTMVGPVIDFNCNCLIAVTGAQFELLVNNKTTKMNKAIQIVAGDRLTFGHLKTGLRAYIAIAGGFALDKVLGSFSTYIRGGIGGYKGRALKNGDLVPINVQKPDHRTISDLKTSNEIRESLIQQFESQMEGPHIIRVIDGPEIHSFSDDAVDTFYSSEYEISNASDRMGYKLNGAHIKHNNEADILSSGLTLGTIQVPGHGQPIIMMSDHQTTGGYTRIANVISTDISYLAQLGPGCKIRFEKVDIKEAHRILRKVQDELDDFIQKLNETVVNKIASEQNLQVYVNHKKYNVLVQEVDKS